ncbi:hypothetical protein NPIL_163391 [Nephila pilipes]|uniref:Uncharacterized protein n=1 Tax=Nephila pilipes TaxID=299642 RepID=A0A8X6THB4_NEPPI|nr:hypothetical protein NPIL_163391 [Nephila pilipes]
MDPRWAGLNTFAGQSWLAGRTLPITKLYACRKAEQCSRESTENGVADEQEIVEKLGGKKEKGWILVTKIEKFMKDGGIKSWRKFGSTLFQLKNVKSSNFSSKWP